MWRIRRILAIGFYGGLVVGAAALGWSLWLHAAYAGRIYTHLSDVPAEERPRVAIVFGAGLTRSGNPSPVLYDRIVTAVELYRAGRADKLLLTGDNRFANYNEPEAMRRAALGLGVPDDDLVLDYAGRRTYDSCYRARAIFGVERAILVTQVFHLDRALYLCDAFGIDSIGVSADRRSYSPGAETGWSIREVAAKVMAWVDVNITRPAPVLGEQMPIGR